LNRSEQVDDPSLDSLRRHFDEIRRVLDGRPGADQIAQHQGDGGDIYVTEVLAMTFERRSAVDRLLEEVVDDLVGVCLGAHRDDNLKPDMVGKRESTYQACCDKVIIHLLRSGVSIA
jgi:hypothetical protein